MADAEGQNYADLARQRAEAAAASLALTRQAEKRASDAAVEAESRLTRVTELLGEVEQARKTVTDLRAAARQDAEQAKSVLQAAELLHATLAAGTIPYNDAETELGAATVAEAIARIADLARSAGGGQAGVLNFEDPNQSGLFPAL